MRERLERELLLIIWDRPQTILWMKRSGRYFPFIEAMLKKNSMPDDLKYVAIIESSLMPHVGSNKGALGYRRGGGSGGVAGYGRAELHLQLDQGCF